LAALQALFIAMPIHEVTHPMPVTTRLIDGVVITFINISTCQAKVHVQGR
jgi:hypothetical protein